MKCRITIDIESDIPLNSVAQKLKNTAEESVREILCKTKANAFVNANIHKMD